MSSGLTQPKKVWKQADLEALPDNGLIHEVVNGQLVMSPKNSFLHGDVCAELLTALRIHARMHKLGVVCDSSTGFWMANRNCRAPDISFIAKHRLQGLKRPPSSFIEGAPDLAVEIVAPSNTARELADRLQDYFSSGTRLAWLIHPTEQFAEVFRAPNQRKILGPGGLLDGEDVVPGFSFPMADLFREWDWEV